MRPKPPPPLAAIEKPAGLAEKPRGAVDRRWPDRYARWIRDNPAFAETAERLAVYREATFPGRRPDRIRRDVAAKIITPRLVSKE